MFAHPLCNRASSKVEWGRKIERRLHLQVVVEDDGDNINAVMYRNALCIFCISLVESLENTRYKLALL